MNPATLRQRKNETALQFQRRRTRQHHENVDFAIMRAQVQRRHKELHGDIYTRLPSERHLVLAGIVWEALR